jgi:hypothetical protein
MVVTVQVSPVRVISLDLLKMQNTHAIQHDDPNNNVTQSYETTKQTSVISCYFPLNG